MEKLDPQQHEEFMETAWREAEKAKCHKSHFGAVIVKDGKVKAVGHNAPPNEEICEECLRKKYEVGSGKASELCRSVHAEQNALLNALRNQKDIEEGVMYIGHLKDGKKKKFSGKPFCTVCSRLIAASGLRGVIFYAGEKYIYMCSKEFNERSLETIEEYYVD